MRPQRWIPIGVVLLLVMIIAAATWAVRSREAPEVGEMRQLTAKMFDQHIEPQERIAVGEMMRQLKQNIPADRRQEVYREMGEDFRQQVNEHVRKFASLPEDQRLAFLDRDIEMKQMFGRGDGQRGRREKKKQSKFDSMSKQQLAALKRTKLDNTSAEDRAYMMEYIKALKQRMQERGLDSWHKDK